MSATARYPSAGEAKRDVFLLEIERGRTIAQARRAVGWTETAYWTQRSRHRGWAIRVDHAIQHSWESGTYGRASILDGRSMRGAITRWVFLERISDGESPTNARRNMNWSGPAYWQARYRHPDWADEVDRVSYRHLTQLHLTALTRP